MAPIIAAAHPGAGPLAPRLPIGARDPDGTRAPEPYDTPGGWGFDPQRLRLEPMEGTESDQYYARHRIAAVAMKTATTISGVEIAIYNRNQCTDEEWRERLGRFFCKPADLNASPPPGWSYDWGSFLLNLDPLEVKIFPLVALGSPGVMDLTIPGHHVPSVLGTRIHADPEWENCAWPAIFEPDELSNADTTAPGVYDFTSQTYRFGKNPSLDIRAVLATNWRRSFCFQPLPDR